MKLEISLDKMRFYAYHGVLEQERAVGNHYELSLRFEINKYSSLESDALNDTISYAEVYELISECMERPSQLLEHVAGRIVRCLFDRFEEIQHIKLKLSKQKPPISGDLQSASVHLELFRGEL